MQPPEHPGRAPDYTDAFLGSFFVILLILLVIIWAAWGLPAALAGGWAADLLIGRLRGV